MKTRHPNADMILQIAQWVSNGETEFCTIQADLPGELFIRAQVPGDTAMWCAFKGAQFELPTIPLAPGAKEWSALTGSELDSVFAHGASGEAAVLRAQALLKKKNGFV